MLKLIIEDDERQKTVVPFVRQEITIGRQPGNTIRLTERNVSRRHARLVRENGHVLLEDLGSYNGTQVNGEPLDGKRILQDSDQIRIGDYELSLQSGAAVEVAKANAASRLVALNSNYAGREFACTNEEVRIGRDPASDIFLNLRSLSQTHAQLIRTAEGWEIGAVQGRISVNGQPVDRAQLQSGDVVTLGKLELKFVGPGTVQLVPISPPTGWPARKWIAVLLVPALVYGGYRLLSSSRELLEPIEPALPALSPLATQKPASPAFPLEGRDRTPPAPSIGLGQEISALDDRAAVRQPPSPSRRKDVRQAKTVAVLRRSETNAEEPRRLYQHGAELLRTNQLSEAALVLNQCVKLDPAYARCHRMLGATYARMHDPERGALHYKRYLQLAPDDPESLRVRALLEQYESTRGLSKQE